MTMMTPIPAPRATASRRRVLLAMHAFVRLTAQQQLQFVALMEAAADTVPLPAPGEDARACLAHLLSWPLYVAPGGTIADGLAVAAAHPDGPVACALQDHGIRWVGAEVWVALWHQPILRVFEKTPWERTWVSLLRSLPPARVTTMTSPGGLHSKAIALPAALLDLPIIVDGEPMA